MSVINETWDSQHKTVDDTRYFFLGIGMNPYCHGRRGFLSAGGTLRCLFGFRSPKLNKFKPLPPPSPSSALTAALSSEVSSATGRDAGRR